MAKHIDFLLEVFEQSRESVAVIHRDRSYTYSQLIDRVTFYDQRLTVDMPVERGAVVSLVGDFSLESMALFFALIGRGVIVVPMMRDMVQKQKKAMEGISQIEYRFSLDDHDQCTYSNLRRVGDHRYYQMLRQSQASGLVLFTSGTSGAPKATVHNFDNLLDKFKHRRPVSRMLNFFLFDHWGGLNTMLHILSNGGTLVTVEDRSVSNVCSLIEKYKIDTLPTSPTFLNMLLVSRAYEQFDLSCLKHITYGSEPMGEQTLKRIQAIFPEVKIQQTYGLIEVGVLRSKSKSPESLWVKLGGEGVQWRVVDDILQIRSHSTMLGYLNSESPFTEDGWFVTGDQVEQQGDYLKILGRRSEMINIGGEKVYPTEVENVIMTMDNVAEVTVFSRDSAITGKLLCATVRLLQPEKKLSFTDRLKKHCLKQLPLFKVPVRIILSEKNQTGYRMKKIRHLESSS